MAPYLARVGVGAAVASILQPQRAAWVGDAHERLTERVRPAMIVDPPQGMAERRR